MSERIEYAIKWWDDIITPAPNEQGAHDRLAGQPTRGTYGTGIVVKRTISDWEPAEPLPGTTTPTPDENAS